VTGGSSGIGKCVAIEAATRGADVTLIARDVKKLESAVSEVAKYRLYHEKQKVQFISRKLVVIVAITGHTFYFFSAFATTIHKVARPI
jgi:short-subunit dehydrogenase